jgi:hypothetical protein
VLLKEKISIENFEDKKFKIRLVESGKDTEAAFYLSVTLTGQTFRSNPFTRSLQKGFLLQYLTQNVA